MNELERLSQRCKGGVTLEINPHLGVYETAGTYLRERDLSETDPRITFEMVKRNRVVRVQFYPSTPVGFFVVYHHDIDEALREANRALDIERAQRKLTAALAKAGVTGLLPPEVNWFSTEGMERITPATPRPGSAPGAEAPPECERCGWPKRSTGPRCGCVTPPSSAQ